KVQVPCPIEKSQGSPSSGCPMPEKSNTPNRQLSKPKAGWLPLPKAVFRFGVADEWDAAAKNTPTGRAMEAGALSLPRLEATLKEASGAGIVEIDPALCTFVFQFFDRGSIWAGPPWALLEQLMRRKLPSIHERMPKPFSIGRAW